MTDLTPEEQARIRAMFTRRLDDTRSKTINRLTSGHRYAAAVEAAKAQPVRTADIIPFRRPAR
ncbi:hypothetical protein ACC685_33430 [Rhizobium ruizarguesonis]